MRHTFKTTKNIPIHFKHDLTSCALTSAVEASLQSVCCPLQITCTVDRVGDGQNGFDAALYAVSTRAAERVGHSFERNLQLHNLNATSKGLLGVLNY